MSEVKPKKMVSRNVAIALAIICIVLVVGLVGALAYYMPMINDKNNTISSLNTQISQTATNITNLQTWLNGNETLLNQTSIAAFNSLNSTYNSYVSTHSHTNSDYNSLSDIAGLMQSEEWVSEKTMSNSAGSVAKWTSSSAVPYAGFIGIKVNSLTNNNKTDVEVTYTYQGNGNTVKFDATQPVGVSGTVAIPILPTTNLVVNIGTSDGSAASETVTIVYFY